MANDPYKVLGLERTATDEEVKKAYRELARKYHPDNYMNTPLADLAEEKMKEINEAYETIQKSRKENADRASDPSHGNTAGSSYGRERLYEIRSYIESNNFYEAEIRLNSVPNAARSAEWYFLKGIVFRARGWYFEAAKYFEAACRMDPDNSEYLAALDEIQSFTASHTRARRDDTVCNLCCGLMAADCCCECCGGDLISCC